MCVTSQTPALTVPLAMPERDLLIFVTFGVILATLVGQGLTLPVIILALGARIDQLADEWPTHLPLIDTLRAQYGHRATLPGNHPANADGSPGEGASAAEQELVEHRKIRRAVIDAERAACRPGAPDRIGSAGGRCYTPAYRV